uniref:Tubulin-specific chaperone A n=3 Tax=Canis lupus TaxID=9612 RepID=A0A8C0PEX5_CANLF
MVNPQMRQVKIKTGMVTGLVKEKMMYEKRNKTTREKIKKKKKAKDCENYPIKKVKKDLQEADEYKETCLVLDLVKLEA